MAVPDTTPSCPAEATARARRQFETAIPIPPWMTCGKRDGSIMSDDKVVSCGDTPRAPGTECYAHLVPDAARREHSRAPGP
ncbi:MAG: hypothetical protein AMXMBFR55_15980 [Gemmatimonadota bacterium]